MTAQAQVPSVERRKILAYRMGSHRLSRPAADLPQAAASCGLQDTPPGGAAQGLHARVPGATPDEVDRALADTKELIVVWSRRGSPHLVPTEDLAVFTLGLMPTSEDGWRTAIAGFVSIFDRHGMSATEVVQHTNRPAARHWTGAS